MFIIGILVIWVLSANSVIVPSVVTWIVGILAALEALLYLFIIITNIVLFRKAKKDIWR